uniref:Pre-B-cell leukemia transcription factor-interacting protein 1 n=1 Tax=Leptobrachium leishanense TaxID=445787 RepID=A0A8C5R707_9ANUR
MSFFSHCVHILLFGMSGIIKAFFIWFCLTSFPFLSFPDFSASISLTLLHTILLSHSTPIHTSCDRPLSLAPFLPPNYFISSSIYLHFYFFSCCLSYEELEEVSCSSSEDDAEGLRKRKVRGSPPVSVGASTKEAVAQEDDVGFGLTLNKCIIAALALIGIGFLALSGELSYTPETVIARSVSGEDGPPQAIVDIQEWMNQHAAQFSGDPGSFKVIGDLLDKVAKENQDIRHMQAKLQAQKEELESILRISEGETVSPAPLDDRLSNENLRLKEALLKEETAHLLAKEELQSLREKMETLDASSLEGQQLVSENSKLKEELDTAQNQIESFLPQKETLLAEALMLRQELDKQRSLVGTLRRDLESLIAQKSSPDVDEQQLQGKITDISNQLALEVQRSETWEKTYVEHAEKRKSQVGDYSPKEWKKAEKHGRTHNFSASGGEFRKHGKDHGKRLAEGERRESPHEEWKSRKHEHREEQRDQPGHKKHRHWEGEKRGEDHQATGNERGWKDKHSKHHHGEEGGGFHPRKGQKDFLHSATEDEDKRKHKEQGGKPHQKESHHKHHDHNKFWKKLSDHQYRIPEGCSGVEDCARKDGIDLFDVELKPVQRKQFEDVLHSYLAKTNFSKHLPGLVPLLDGFFEGHVFAHDKVRFRDFVDDVEDFLEELAKKETGSDDSVDDFEKYVYTHFFGEADSMNSSSRFAKKEAHKINGTNEDHWKKSSAHEPHNHPKKEHWKKEFEVERSPTEDPRSPDHKPPRKEYHDVHYHRHEHRPQKTTTNMSEKDPKTINLTNIKSTNTKINTSTRNSIQSTRVQMDIPTITGRGRPTLKWSTINVVLNLINLTMKRKKDTTRNTKSMTLMKRRKTGHTATIRTRTGRRKDVTRLVNTVNGNQSITGERLLNQSTHHLRMRETENTITNTITNTSISLTNKSTKKRLPAMCTRAVTIVIHTRSLKVKKR